MRWEFKIKIELLTERDWLYQSNLQNFMYYKQCRIHLQADQAAAQGPRGLKALKAQKKLSLGASKNEKTANQPRAQNKLNPALSISDQILCMCRP